MKKIILVGLFALTCLISLIYSSCKKDACSGVNCQNGGACSGGKCVCPSGYIGTYCENDACQNVTCQNNGWCLAGICHCPQGYSGTYCETESKGDVTFYTSTNYGTVSVSINGQSGGISYPITFGTPSCNESGCANFSLSPGTYSFSASCSIGTWSGNVTIVPNGCMTVHLD